MNIKSITLGVVQTNCYLISNEETSEVILVDPGDKALVLKNKIEELGLKPVGILLTHGHFDHIMAAREIADNYNISIYAYKAEKELLENANLNGGYMIGKTITLMPDLLLEDNEILILGGFTIQVIHTPGHTAGGVCYYFMEDNALISGDTLFLESIGRTDLPTGDSMTLIDSIKNKLMILPDNLVVYPGHGDATTIGYEKNHNPYI